MTSEARGSRPLVLTLGTVRIETFVEPHTEKTGSVQFNLLHEELRL